MNNEIQIFKNNEFGEIRGILINDEPWFIGRDVAESLGYGDGNNKSKSLTNAIKDHVDEEDKILLSYEDFKGYQNDYLKNISHYGAYVINESGLYSLIFSSRLPNAKKFKKWVTSEVLPQIRQTGGYIPITENDSDEDFLAKAVLIAQKTISKKNVIIQKQNEQLQQQKPQVEYYNNVLNPTDFKKLVTVTSIAKDLGTTATKLNKILNVLGIQYKKSKSWVLTTQYEYLIKENYADYTINEFGQNLKWTETGRQFIIDTLRQNNYLTDNGTIK